MENGSRQWRFQGNKRLSLTSAISLRGIVEMLMGNLSTDDPRPTIPLGNGDPSQFPCFKTPTTAEEAIVDALHSAKYNGYAPTSGVPSARRAIANYLNRDLPYKLSADDVHLTSGCLQAIEVALAAITQPGASILLPRPAFTFYESRAAYENLQVRQFDLLPDKGWEVDIDAVEALADENTVAMVVINPGNPCGSVYSYDHLELVAETARKLGILVIADEVYSHITFGSTPFVPMGVFGSIVPVLSLGSISKRWVVPGWRLGWLATTDPNGILQKSGIVESITGCCNITSDPATFIQGAVPQILENTKDEFFSKLMGTLKEAAQKCFDGIKEVPCLTCPSKPEGSMFVLVKLNASVLEDISDDLEFCMKLAKEEKVVIIPAGTAFGMKNWLRITFACEIWAVEEGIRRIKAFYQRHAKKQ
ncbi:putative aminotransferase TAT2 [Hibiscus syriacus]|uniref:Aminotransferase TAT2 n=1 Tax=Hibiscus syriacus TaxID=106335 RepID=A0A6A2YKJ0_HIBSY|nr:probable aminotransferase TAT2 isoform X2 [Hibiscus syriacus]KAE8677804.1 putative aminotransferase TAT2 [Hibiscus syriacus]